MLTCLPPVGNPVELTAHSSPAAILQAAFLENDAYLYGSGTMALAAALTAATAYRHVEAPEVLMPAYACPDLVSAAHYAGLKPVLVDLVADRHWMDLGQLQQKIGPNTVAVIAAHLLGLPERLPAIREVLNGTDILLIEDSAQLFPSAANKTIWQGDLIVLSFGRGKPVSLFGGGAVISQRPALSRLLPKEATTSYVTNLQSEPGQANWKYTGKVKIFNALLTPLAYGVLRRLPLLHLGQTIYKPLSTIEEFSMERLSILASNIIAYQQRTRQAEQWISHMLAESQCEGILDLPAQFSGRAGLPLLRYPVLLRDKALRDRLDYALLQAGIGCSKMYTRPLPEIEGLENMFNDVAHYPEAGAFSDRLLSLPCHEGVTIRHVDRIKSVIQTVVG